MSDVLNPIRRVQVRDGQIEVRELTWKELSYVLQELSETVLGFMDDKGVIKIDPVHIVAAIKDNEALLAYFLSKSCNREDAWVNQLSLRDMLTLLDAAIELTLSEEVLELGKKLAGRMAQRLGLPKLPLGLAISSSVKATASETPTE